MDKRQRCNGLGHKFGNNEHTNMVRYITVNKYIFTYKAIRFERAALRNE